MADIKRIPVTKESYKKPTTKNAAKVGTPVVQSTPVDKTKVKKAAMGGFGFGWNTFSGSGMNTSVHNNSYANMGQSAGGFGDVPLYFALMNEQNGGILYWPVTLKEKYSWYRYWARVDPFVRAAVRLHSDLPMSKLVLRMPKMKDMKLRKRILRKYENMMKNIKLFDRLHSILFETNVIGNAMIFCEFDEEKKEWSKLVLLPQEEVTISKLPMSDDSKIQYVPEVLNSIIKRFTIPIDSEEEYELFLERLDDEERLVMSGLSFDLVKNLVENNGSLIMDTNPYVGDNGHEVGSFVFHFHDVKHDYYDLAASPLECVVVPLLMKEHYKYTQLNLASRNMTPRNKVSAPEISRDDLEELREQLDMSMLNPDYSIVTNYEWNWEQLGSQDRLIDLSREYETIENQLFAGLGVTRELMTGEGLYSGNKISIEILNTRYLLVREMLQRFVEENLFLPMAVENGWFAEDEDGNREYFYPRLSFTRLTIRDNAEVFDSLFSLYQKGSIPIDTILDLFNLDSDEIHEKLLRDQFTVKDAVYNDMLRGIYGSVGDRIIDETDLVEQIIANTTGPNGKKLNIKPKGDEDGGDGDDFGGGGDFGGNDFGSHDDDSGSEVDVSDIVDDSSIDETEDTDEGEKEESELTVENLLEMTEDATENTVDSDSVSEEKKSFIVSSKKNKRGRAL